MYRLLFIVHTLSCIVDESFSQVWMWERLPVGRPYTFRDRAPWFPQNNPIVALTVGHLYESAAGTYNLSRSAYIQYINELDQLTPAHVSNFTT